MYNFLAKNGHYGCYTLQQPTFCVVQLDKKLFSKLLYNVLCAAFGAFFIARELIKVEGRLNFVHSQYQLVLTPLGGATSAGMATTSCKDKFHYTYT